MTLASSLCLNGDAQWRSGGNTANAIHSDGEVTTDDIAGSANDHNVGDAGVGAWRWIRAIQLRRTLGNV